MRRSFIPVLAFLASCAIHPEGERDERVRAEAAGEPYAEAFEERTLPPLAPDASLDEIVRRALLANADLESKFFEWKAALERIPQEASPPGTAALSFGRMFDREGTSAWDSTTLGVLTDPMENLPLPTKLATAGRRALEEARAAGLRFDRARYALRAEVVRACVDLDLLDEKSRIAGENEALLDVVVAAAEARTRSGLAPQQDWLAVRTLLDLARNERLDLEAARPGTLARLNALLGRAPKTPLVPTIPAARPLPEDDGRILAEVAERNPELRALAREVEGKRDALSLARQAYLPDFAFSAAITGSVSRAVAGMVTLPLLRTEAIEGGIAEARADLRAAQAMRRQVGSDLAARTVLELYALRNWERQAELFGERILPRALHQVDLARGAYAAGAVGIAEVLDGLRTWLETRRTLAVIRADREKSLASLEELAARAFPGIENPAREVPGRGGER